MAIEAGKNIAVAISVDDVTYYELPTVTQQSADLVVEMLDATALGDEAHKQVGGLFDGSLTIDGKSSGEANGVVALLDSVVDGTAVWVQIDYASVSVNVKCVVESAGIRIAHDGLLEYSIGVKAIAVSDTTHHAVTTLSADGPYAGRLSSVYVTGTSTLATAEAMTLVSGTTYKITNAAKNVFDPASTVTVYDGGVAVSSSTYTIDYLFGQVTLGAAPGGAVTVTCHYLPKGEIAEGTGASIDIKADLVESSAFGSESREKTKVLKSATGSIDMQQHARDAVVSGNALRDIVEARSAVVVEIILDDGARAFRAFALLQSLSRKAAPSGLVTSSISFTASEQDALHSYSDAPSFAIGEI